MNKLVNSIETTKNATYVLIGHIIRVHLNSVPIQMFSSPLASNRIAQFLPQKFKSILKFQYEFEFQLFVQMAIIVCCRSASIKIPFPHSDHYDREKKHSRSALDKTSIESLTHSTHIYVVYVHSTVHFEQSKNCGLIDAYAFTIAMRACMRSRRDKVNADSMCER